MLWFIHLLTLSRISAGLEPTQQRLLENAPGNPNSPKKPEVAVGARPGLGFSKSTTGPPKPSLRETMLAQKRPPWRPEAFLLDQVRQCLRFRLCEQLLVRQIHQMRPTQHPLHPTTQMLPQSEFPGQILPQLSPMEVFQ